MADSENNVDKMMLPKPNASQCEESIARVLAAVDAYVLLIDADGLKGINDKYGHPAGTAYLTEIWERMHRAFPNTIWIRYGGDEFYGAVICSMTNESELLKRAKNATGMAMIHGRNMKVAFSMGVYRAARGESAIAAMAMADRAMYKVKKVHHGGAAVFSPDRTMILYGNWPEEWITVPVSQNWRVLVYAEVPEEIPEADLIVARQALECPWHQWIPDSEDVSLLLQQLQIAEGEFSVKKKPQALAWEDEVDTAMNDDPNCTAAEASIPQVSSEEDRHLEPKWHGEFKGNTESTPDMSEDQDFIPWRVVHPPVWESSESEVVPIITDDPLRAKRSITEDIPVPSLKESSQGALGEKVSSLKEAFSLIELPHITMPQIQFKIPELPSLKQRTVKEKEQLVNKPQVNSSFQWFRGTVLWFWGIGADKGDLPLVEAVAEYMASSIPVILLEGKLTQPTLAKRYHLSGLGWETSWANKSPGKRPNNVFERSNLTVWALKDPLDKLQPTQEMWSVALFHIRSPEHVVIVDARTSPPPEIDGAVRMVNRQNFPAASLDYPEIIVSQQGLPSTLPVGTDVQSIRRLLTKLRECKEGFLSTPT